MRVQWAISVIVSILIIGFPSVMGDGIIDQTHPLGPSNAGCSNTAAFLPSGQEFTPTVSNLVAIDFYISGVSPTSITVNIRSSSITGTIVGSETHIFSSAVDGFTPSHFDFPTPVPLIPGSIYVIEPITPTSFSWCQSLGDDYPGGMQIKLGSPTGRDYAFSTFFTEGVVGGTVLPIDTTALLVAGAYTSASWMIPILISAVGIGLAVFTLKRSR